MRTFEYSTLTGGSGTFGTISENDLNRYGAHGWEVVSVSWTHDRDGAWMRGALLKRETTPVEAPKGRRKA